MADQTGFALTEAAQRYAWRTLAVRAGLPATESPATGFEFLGLPVHYAGPPPLRKTWSPALYVVPARPPSWENLRELPPGKIDWLPPEQTLPAAAQTLLHEDIPVLFWGTGCQSGEKPFAELRSDGALIFYADVLAAAVFMLARWEETVTPDRDEHGRFPGQSSAAYRQGFLDRPVIDEYGIILRAWLKALLPAWQPVPKRFHVQLSHDIDHLSIAYSRRLRLFLSDVVKDRNLPMAVNTFRYIAGGPWSDPLVIGSHTLADLARQNGLHSTFYYMTAGPGPMDEGYDIASSLAHRELERVQRLGFSVGLHTGFGVLDHPAQAIAEKARLEAQLGVAVKDVRQHYLRIAIPYTWRILEEAGFLRDSSLGYSDVEGFRAGTCHPFPVYDLEQDRELRLEELPLVVMDTTLKAKRSLSPAAARHRILELAERCKLVEGCFSLLWHNSSLWREFRAWRKLYRELLPDLKKME